MTAAEDRTGMGVARGTYADAKQMIGHRSDVQFAEIEVNWPMIKYFCALTEDGNPSYWDTGFAAQQWGGIIAPPGMLMAWLMPIQWRPGGGSGAPLIATQVPLPGETLINVSTETEYLIPIQAGDHLNMVDEVVDITPEKKTRLGTGHFITTLATYRNQRGQVVAKNTNVMFRYTTKG
jgi:acyl dehydratase